MTICEKDRAGLAVQSLEVEVTSFQTCFWPTTSGQFDLFKSAPCRVCQWVVMGKRGRPR